MVVSLRKVAMAAVLVVILLVVLRSYSRGQPVRDPVDASPVFNPAPTTTAAPEVIEAAEADNFPKLPAEAEVVAREVAGLYLAWSDALELPSQLERLKSLTTPEVYQYMERDLRARQLDAGILVGAPVLEDEIEAFQDTSEALVAVVVYTQRVALTNVESPESISQQPGVLTLRLVPSGSSFGWVVAGYS